MYRANRLVELLNCFCILHTGFLFIFTSGVEKKNGDYKMFCGATINMKLPRAKHRFTLCIVKIFAKFDRSSSKGGSEQPSSAVYSVL